ncbi:Bacterial cellulose synthase subunit [Thiorhodovibrio frisius]|uniref:Cyclic di-GMP-binding protein n=2 Tax=Thiorhodovibrio frisius TaxID=631362 RepID=H8Z205_9GAMM|nr:Bacterial cellulose synthase subunit [Thiorhodovibrio frisius]
MHHGLCFGPSRGLPGSALLLMTAIALSPMVIAQDAAPQAADAAAPAAVQPANPPADQPADQPTDQVTDQSPNPSTSPPTGQAMGQSATQSANGAAPLRAEQDLASFLYGKTSIMLQGAQARASVTLPLPAAWDVQAFTLRLKYRNSGSLVRDRSQLRVALNGLIIGQFALDPERPEGEARIPLPRDLLEVGSNYLEFSVAQHTNRPSCEDPRAPELWTQIDAKASTLTLEYQRLFPTLKLSGINNFVKRHRWGQGRLRILMPLTDGKADADQLRWGALVAQAAAIGLLFNPLESRLEPLHPFAKQVNAHYGDIVLVGTRDQLKGALGADWADTVTDAYLGIRSSQDLAGTAGKAAEPWVALVVSGRDEAEVTRAATALGVMREPLPAMPSALIKTLELPDIPDNTGPHALIDGAVASFADLGASTTTLTSPLLPATLFSGEGGDVLADLPTSLGLNFWVPAGFFPGRPLEGVVTLNFSYGARLRGDSVLNLSLNGIFVRAIPLDQPAGSVERGYEVRFPLSLLRPGSNQLDLSPMLVPSYTGECDLRQGENLLLTIDAESSLQLPPVQRLATLPDLELLARAGYPWLRDPTGSDLAVELGDATPATASAAWTLLGRMAQITGVPLFRASIGSNIDEQQPNEDRDLLMIGAVPVLKSKLCAAGPISCRDGQVRIDYPVLEAVMPAKPDKQWAERGLAGIESWFDPPKGRLGRFDARFGLTEPESSTRPSGDLLGERGALFSFESPNAPGRAVLMLTARTPELLQERTARLVQPDFWYNLKGGMVLWEQTEQSLFSQSPRRTFTVGEVNTGTWLNYLLSAYPAALISVTLLLAVLLASLLFVVTGRFRRRRHPQVPEDA